MLIKVQFGSWNTLWLTLFIYDVGSSLANMNIKAHNFLNFEHLQKTDSRNLIASKGPKKLLSFMLIMMFPNIFISLFLACFMKTAGAIMLAVFIIRLYSGFMLSKTSRVVHP